jgi:hypothetical protein
VRVTIVGDNSDAADRPAEYFRFYALAAPGGEAGSLPQGVSPTQVSAGQAQAKKANAAAAEKAAYYAKSYPGEVGPWNTYDEATGQAIVAAWDAFVKAGGLGLRYTNEWGTITFSDHYGKFWRTTPKQGLQEGTTQFVDLGDPDVLRPQHTILNTVHVHTNLGVDQPDAGGDNNSPWKAYVIRAKDLTIWFMRPKSHTAKLFGSLIPNPDGSYKIVSGNKHFSDAEESDDDPYKLADNYGIQGTGSDGTGKGVWITEAQAFALPAITAAMTSSSGGGNNCHWYAPWNCTWGQIWHAIEVPVLIFAGATIGTFVVFLVLVVILEGGGGPPPNTPIPPGGPDSPSPLISSGRFLDTSTKAGAILARESGPSVSEKEVVSSRGASLLRSGGT